MGKWIHFSVEENLHMQINASVQELKKTYDTGFKNGYDQGLKVDEKLKQLSK